MTDSFAEKRAFAERVREHERWRTSRKPGELIDYADLAGDYQRASIGYSAELYATISELGMPRGAKILDIGCGPGIASEPLAREGASITGLDVAPVMLEFARARMPAAQFVQGSAEALPFEDDSFGGAICAQAFHWFDREKAMAEMIRVVSPGGGLAIWWKHLMNDDPVKLIRDEVCKEFKVSVPDAGLLGGFIEFYKAPLVDHALRVVPWRIAVPLERFMAYERSRYNLRAAFGSNLEKYFKKLEAAIVAKYGTENAFLPLSYMHYLYIAKKP